MEIRPDEIVKTREIPYDLFIHGIKTLKRRRGFVRKLKKVLCEFLNPILVGTPELIEKQKKMGYIHTEMA